jgi:Glycosyltransferase like family 2
MTAVLWILLIAWGLIAILNTVTAWRYSQGLPFPEIPKTTPPVAVIVAVKGASDITRTFFERLRHQAYPVYRIIAAVESKEDPAFAMVTEEANRPGAALRVVVAGQSERTGQKVWNLLAAIDAIEASDEIVAFIDADTLPDSGWLSRLVASLINPVNPGREAVTGYRWIVPADKRVSSAVVAAANASVVTLLRLPYIFNHCWGGTIAMRRETLERIAIHHYWAGAISDDAQMTRAFIKARVPIFSPRQSLLLSPVAMNWSEALSFGRRQYRIIWLHDRRLWALAAIGTIVPIAGAGVAVGMALQGSFLAIALIAASLFLGEVRYRSRRRIFAALWGDAAAAGLAAYWRVERLLRPLWLSFHVVCVLSALGSHHIRWADIDYFVRGPQDIDVSRPRSGCK